ncbi:SURF1 family protein [Actinotalea sp. M2MS4P-6]|uniref:SURF1 family cytochrome oxidase biogenesis protein n=1 Tax=Actinotalea sp. M2MS4P-6 TaxID=2983762 RepID=UPI0021E4BA44|nr:SURF1 family protein [Actinotalea sp. M2MS4P-6]MCV2393343.1 SURF1 family protein [Actinotalea sp. M2MS4P-6]
MSDWRRVVATLGVASLVAAACTMLGLWQWHRHVARSAAVAVLLSWTDATPVPIDEALPDGGPVPDDQVWRPVGVEGRYLPDAEVLLRNRPVDGQVGFHVLSPFEISTGPLAGQVLLVDRGWLASGGEASVVPDVPEAPTGTVDLVVRLRQAEGLSGRDAPIGQVQSIDPEEARAAAVQPWRGDAVDAYGQAVTENGAAPAGLGPLERPSTDLGPHLSYAFQWWVFAAGALVGAVILLRRGEDSPRPARVRSSAEQEEDAILDAQERAARGTLS